MLQIQVKTMIGRNLQQAERIEAKDNGEKIELLSRQIGELSKMIG